MTMQSSSKGFKNSNAFMEWVRMCECTAGGKKVKKNVLGQASLAVEEYRRA